MKEARIELLTPVVDPELPWDPRRPAESEVELRRSLADLGAPGNEARACEILTQIASAQILQEKLAAADATLREAEKLLASTDALVPRLRVLLERGRLLTAGKTPMTARERFLDVWKLTEHVPEHAFFAADAANMMSKIETPKRRHEWTLRALEVVERSPNDRARRWRGVLYLDVGWNHIELMQLDRAVAVFEQAVAFFRELGSAIDEVRARSFVGYVLRLQRRTAEALALQQGLLAELGRLQLTDGFVLEEIGECLHALKRSAEAEGYFGRAYDVFGAEAGSASRDPGRMKRLKALGPKRAKE